MTAPFKVGDPVALTESYGDLKRGDYGQVVSVERGYLDYLVSWRPLNYNYNIICYAYRLRLAINPCAEMPMPDLDWKSRYANLQAEVERLKSDLSTANTLNTLKSTMAADMTALVQRYQEAMAPLLDDDNKVPSIDLLAKRAAEWKRMARVLFTGSTYNFARQGLTDREAKLDLFDYILEAQGKPKAKRKTVTEELMDSLNAVAARIQPYYLATSSPLLNDYLGLSPARTRTWWPRGAGKAIGPSIDKVEPAEKKGCTGCAEGCSHPDHKKA